MKIQKVKITQVKVNAENPRTITGDKFQRLINSILSLPKMLELRPIVVNERMAALGGNMRLNALKEIAKHNIDWVEKRLDGISDYTDKSDGEKSTLLSYWQKWFQAPTTFIIPADELSEAEKRQFMIKDNVSFGQWDYDQLANQWDSSKLQDWGMDVWDLSPTPFTPQPNGMPAPVPNTAPVDAPSKGEDDSSFVDALPPELQGVDLSPADLPKIEGDNETAMERIILVYPKERTEDVAALLGLQSIDKVVYSIDETVLGEQG